MKRHSIPKNINIDGKKRDPSSLYRRSQKLRIGTLLKEFKELLEKDLLIEARQKIYYIRKEAYRLRFMNVYRLAKNYEREVAVKESIRRSKINESMFNLRPNLTHPSLLNKENSYFYDEREKGAKFYRTVTIIFALKKDYRMPNEKEFDYSIQRRIESDRYNVPWNDQQKFIKLLTDRVKYLLMSIGFKDNDIPRLEYIGDDFDCQDDIELNHHKDLVGNYHFLVIEGYGIYNVWKLCDFLYSNRIIKWGSMNYISHEDIIEKPIQLVEDQLFFLYSFFGDS